MRTIGLIAILLWSLLPALATTTIVVTADDNNGQPITSTIVTNGAYTVTITSDTTVPGIVTSETMGVNTVLPNVGNNLAYALNAQQAALPIAGTIQSLSYYVPAGMGNLRLGVYDSSGLNGAPGVKVAETAEFASVIGWNTQPVTTPTALPMGNYWLVWLTDNGSLGYVADNAGLSTYRTFTYGPLPNQYGVGVSQMFEQSIYATLSVP